MVRILDWISSLLLSYRSQSGTSILLSLTPAISAIFAAGAAIAAWRNSSLANKAQKYTKLSAMLDYRYGDKNFQAKKILKMFYQDEVLKRKDMLPSFEGTRYKYENAKHIDSARNCFVVYFQKLRDLNKAGLLKEREIKGFVNTSDLALLFQVAKPLQDIIDPASLPLDEDSLKQLECGDDIYGFFKNLWQAGHIDSQKHEE